MDLVGNAEVMSEIAVSFDCFGEFWLPTAMRVADLKVALAHESQLTKIAELFVGAQRLDDHHVVGLAPLVAGCHLSLTAAPAQAPASAPDTPWQLACLQDGSIVSLPFLGFSRRTRLLEAPGVRVQMRLGRIRVGSAPGWRLAHRRTTRLGSGRLPSRAPGVAQARRGTAGSLVTVSHRLHGLTRTYQLRGPRHERGSVGERLRSIPASRWIPAAISLVIVGTFALVLNKPMFLLLGLSMPLIVLSSAFFGQDLPVTQVGSDLQPRALPDILPPQITRVAGPHPLDLPNAPAFGDAGPIALVGPRTLSEPLARALLLGRSRFALTASPVPAPHLGTLGPEDWMRWLPSGALGTEQILLLDGHQQVPSWCQTTATVTRTAVTWHAGNAALGTTCYYGLTPGDAERLARACKLHDASASTALALAAGAAGTGVGGSPGTGSPPVVSDSLPRRVVLPDPLVFDPPTSDMDLVLDTQSIAAKAQLPELSPAAVHSGLPVPLGIGAGHTPIIFDLVSDGPHALVAGTTGAGKSELLQTLVLGLAANHSPAQVAIALVDFKGGSGFSHCKDLPHVVGMVTDLDPGSARRAIAGLSIQLKERERLFARHAVTSFTDFHAATGGLVTLPRIVIIVDELRALVDDEPKFVPNLVRIAAQGRSLGVHLVLATQRPNGAITAEMRANLNARLCLRVATEQDALEVLDSTQAAHIPVDLAGRAYLKVGGNSPIALQSYYAAVAATTARVLKATRDPQTGALTRPQQQVQTSSPLLDRVAAITSHWAHLPGPVPLWAPPLPTEVTADLAAPLAPGLIPIGQGEVIGRQTSSTVGLYLGPSTTTERTHPHGNLAILGPSRAGHSTAIGTLLQGAVAAGHHVHGIGLPTPTGYDRLLELGTFAGHHECQRITALLQTLLASPGRRAAVLFIDGLSQLRAPLEGYLQGRTWDLLVDLLRSAAHLNITVVVSSTSGLPSVLAPLIGQRLVFLTASAHDDHFLGAPPPWAGSGRIPGRAVLLGREHPTLVQVAASVLAPKEERQDLETAMPQILDPAPRIPALPTLSRQPAAELGIAFAPNVAVPSAAALTPVEVPLTGHWIVAGTPRSGRTWTATRFAKAHHCRGSLLGLFSASPPRTPLHQPAEAVWHHPMELLPELVSELAQIETTTNIEPALAAVNGGERRARLGTPHQPSTVILDDVDEMMQRNPQLVQRAVDIITGAGHYVVATLRTANLTTVRALPAQLLGVSNGITLAPNQRQHLVFLGQPIEEFTDPGHLVPTGIPPGRGVMVHNGRVVPIQVAGATG